MNLGKLTEKIKNIKFLNELALDNKKIIMIALMSLAVFYVDFNFIFQAQLKALGKGKVEIAKVKKGLDDFNKDFKNMQELKARQVLLHPKQAAKAKTITTENQFPGLLQDISKAANNNQVSILQLRPQREAPNQSGSVVAKAPSGLVTLTILLDLSCGYHNFGKFINELENMQVFVGVKDFKITPLEDNLLKQKVNLTLYTYVKK